MRRLGCLVFAAVALASGPVAAVASGLQAAPRPAPAVDGALLAQFQQRVDTYVQLRKRAEDGLPDLEAGASPVAIAAHQQVLGQKIARMRTGARQGDLLFPELARAVRSVVKRELAGSASALETVRDTEPRAATPGEAVPLRVNAVYGPAASVSSVPATLLLRLPPLPEEVLEYRFVGNALVLRDAVANIVVDFVTGVMP